MEFSISFKTSAKMTSIKHNNRSLSADEFTEPAHQHILREFSNDNIYVMQEDLREVYQELFGNALEEYNAKQKRSDRRIKDFYKHVQKSDALDLQREFIVTLGAKDDWDYLPREEKIKAGQKLAEYVEEFNQRHPNLRMYNAVVHLDEAGAPHAHFNVVPVATGYKNGLQVKPSFSKALKQEGYKGIARELLRDFKDKEVEHVRRKLKEMGHDQRIGLFRNDFRDMREYKQAMRKMDEALEVRKAEIQEEIAQVKGQVEVEKGKLENLEKEVKRYDHVEMDTRIEGSRLHGELKESRKAPFGMRLVADDLLKRALKYLANIHNKFVRLSKANISLAKENERLREVRRELEAKIEEQKKTIKIKNDSLYEIRRDVDFWQERCRKLNSFASSQSKLLDEVQSEIGQERLDEISAKLEQKTEKQREMRAKKRASQDMER